MGRAGQQTTNLSELPPIYTPCREMILSPGEVKNVWRVLEAARTARAHPPQSGYHVRTAGMTADGQVFTGGNLEYGYSDAFVHGETAVVSHAHSVTDERLTFIGFYNEDVVANASVISPCGPCRDVLEEYADPDLILAAGNSRGASVAELHDYLFEEFEKTDPGRAHKAGVVAARLAIHRAVSAYLPAPLRPNTYGVALVDEQGKVWPGSLYTTAGYDSVPPALAAVQAWRSAFDRQKNAHDMAQIVVVRYGALPKVLYRDRQALLELDEVLRIGQGRKEPLPIELLHLDPSTNQVAAAAQTTTAEWLPYPFSPGAFGMHDALRAQHDALFGPQS